MTASDRDTDWSDAREQRGRYWRWVLLYMVGVVYCSVVVGPIGFNFVPRDPAEAFNAFVHTPFVQLGSDQRADWMGNLFMLVPLGFMVLGAHWPSSGTVARALAIGWSALILLAFILVVKFAQLFFPPRTVTINYIVAQSLGAGLGMLLFCLRGFVAGGSLAIQRSGPLLILRLYTLAFFAYVLVPFDFVLSRDDLTSRLQTLPATLVAFPGQGRSLTAQLVLVLAEIVSFIPIGMASSLRNGRQPIGIVISKGLLVSLVLCALSCLVMSGSPSLVGVLYRTLGFVVGALSIDWLKSLDIELLLDRLKPWVLVLALPYIVLVLQLNGLLTPHWRSVGEALNALDYRGFLPLWHDYIVSKGKAVESTVVHLIMFAPIGFMVWLARSRRPGGAWWAALLAAFLSAVVELGRWFKPDLQPDFNEVLVGAIGAVLALHAAPWILRLWTGDEGAPETAYAAEPSRPGGDPLRLRERG